MSGTSASPRRYPARKRAMRRVRWMALYRSTTAQTAGRPSASAPTTPRAPKNGRSAVQKKPSPMAASGPCSVCL